MTFTVTHLHPTKDLLRKIMAEKDVYQEVVEATENIRYPLGEVPNDKS